MADDGMLLNLELPADAFSAPGRIKGGRWKDRLTAKKAATYGRQKVREVTAKRIPDYGEVQSDEEEYVSHEQPPAKKAKVGDGGDRSLRRPKAPHRGDVLPQSAIKGEVISSLFSYNPAPKAAEVLQSHDNHEPVQASNAPLSAELANFANLGLSSTLANHLLNKLDIKAPTAIQRKAIQQLCHSNQDAFIQAETGSGKTLAYLLPIVQRLTNISKQMKVDGQDFSRDSGLFALILAPTRELSNQISMVLESLLSCCHWIVTGTVVGGEKKKSEKARLRKGLNILVATPGRLADHLKNTQILDVSKVRWLVLDEGDRLMELGFEQDLQRIVGVMNLRSKKEQAPIPGLPDRRTTVLCSATIRSDVEQLRTIALKDPVSIAVDPAEVSEAEPSATEQAFSAPTQLKQSYAIVPPKQRLVTLVAVLRQNYKRKGGVMKCIVFLDCADSVDFHFEVLTSDLSPKSSSQPDMAENAASARLNHQRRRETVELSRTNHIPQGNTISESRTQGPALAFTPGKDSKVQVFRLHGSLQQVRRTSTLKAFSTCTEPAVLLSTDVSARGLDLPNVDLVIEYDPPASKDDHLHRIGRTARAGKDGRAMIFLMPGCEEGYVDVLKESKPRNLSRDESDELLEKGLSLAKGIVGETAKSWMQAATDWQLEAEQWVLGHPEHLEQARRAFQAHVRAYAVHVVAERGIFDMKQLHLGHLAKAFALRDKPGSIRVPGQRPSTGNGTKKEVRVPKSGRRNDDDTTVAVDGQDAKRRMQAKIKAMGGVSEFNLG